MEDRITTSIKDGVADVRLTRADKMNALDDDMFNALNATGERLKTEPGLRAVVLSGEGRAFCAGLDTSNFAKMASGEPRGEGRLITHERTARGANHAQNAVLVWRDLPVPVLDTVHGVAFGGGFQLTLGADIRFVAPETKLSILEIKWGLVPDMGAFVLLPSLMREDQARELTFSGRVFTGEEAYALGLATRLCADPYAEALAFAREIASKSPNAIRAGKRLFDLALTADERTVLEAESAEQTELIGSPNQVESVMAAMENRSAVFKD